MHSRMQPARSVGVKAGALGFMLHCGGHAIWQELCWARQLLAIGWAQRGADCPVPGDAAGGRGATAPLALPPLGGRGGGFPPGSD